MPHHPRRAHVTAAPVETLERYSGIDVGVIGEGEATCLDILDHLERGRRSTTCRASSGATRQHWASCKNGAAPDVIPELDELPFPGLGPAATISPPPIPTARSKRDERRAASVITSRGCPFHCTFCDTAVFGSRVRFHSPEYTLRMLHAPRRSVRRPRRDVLRRQLLHQQRAHDGHLQRHDREEDQPLLVLPGAREDDEARASVKARKPACGSSRWASRAAATRSSRRSRRRRPRETAEAATEAKQHGIRTKGNFIFGLPLETKRDAAGNDPFAVDSDLSYIQQSFLTIWLRLADLGNN